MDNVLKKVIKDLERFAEYRNSYKFSYQIDGNYLYLIATEQPFDMEFKFLINIRKEMWLQGDEFQQFSGKIPFHIRFVVQQGSDVELDKLNRIMDDLVSKFLQQAKIERS